MTVRREVPSDVAALLDGFLNEQRTRSESYQSATERHRHELGEALYHHWLALSISLEAHILELACETPGCPRAFVVELRNGYRLCGTCATAWIDCKGCGDDLLETEAVEGGFCSECFAPDPAPAVHA